MPNGRISPGFFTADAAAALSRVLERLDRLEAAQHLAPAGGLSFQGFAGGSLVTDQRPEPFWARLTSAGVGVPTPWGWVESYESAPGVWADYPDGRSSGTANTPGFAAPGAAGAAGQVVRMLLSQGPAGDHYVFGPPPGVFLEDVTFQDTTVTFVNVTVVFDPTTTVTFQGETLFAYLSCFAAFDDTLSLSSTNNWSGVTAAWAFQPWVRLAGNGGTDCGLTSVEAPPGTDEGCSFWLLYAGPGTLHLTHQDAAGTAANRIITPTSKDHLLRAGQCAQLRYDRAQSRWRVLSGESDMTGATSLADGAPGLVPRPLIADRTLYLDGSGDWSAPAGLIEVKEADGAPDYTGVSVLVFDQADGFVISQPGAGQARVDLSAFGGATSVAAGSRGAVPAPAAGDQAKFLRGDATWVAAGGAIEVKEQDGTPDYTGVSVLSVHQGAGLSLSQPGGAGTAQLTILSASATQAGVVDTSTQTFAGHKTFSGAVTLSGGVTGTIATSGGISEGGGGNLSGFGTVSVSTGFTCNGFAGANTSFATGDGRTATVVGGIITDVS
jgi:hypothetical protein